MVRGHAFSWRAPDGGVRTTVVGKISMALGAPGNPFVAAEPIVHFDRIAADRRFVDEVGELMPWTTSASVVVRGGPLRIEIHADGQQPRTIEVKEGAPVGISMASEGRAKLAKQHLSRGDDGLLAVAPGTDPRYFTAAPPWQGIERIAGNERFVIERGGQRLVVGPLPAIALVADMSLAGHPRRVVLTIDLVVLDAIKSRLSFVARAVLVGFAEIRDMRMTTRGDVGTTDVGDAPPSSMRGARVKTPFVPVAPPVPGTPHEVGPRAGVHEEPTNAIPAAAIAASKRRAPSHLAGTAPISPVLLARVAMPFASGPKHLAAGRGDSRPDLPATPFERGFAPAPTMPAANVGKTVSGKAYPEMTLPVDSAAIAAYRGASSQNSGQRLRDQAGPAAGPPTGTPEEAWSVLGEPSGQDPQGSQDDSPRVAAPRKGAMAKPRPRKR